MQRFAVVLFALIALFAIGGPSSVNALSQKRETNADRFARGLNPLAPARRATAKRSQSSQTSIQYALNIYGGRFPSSDYTLVVRATFRFVTGVAILAVTSSLARTYICILVPCALRWTH
jgi:Zn-dependent protease with chaperone function